MDISVARAVANAGTPRAMTPTLRERCDREMSFARELLLAVVLGLRHRRVGRAKDASGLWGVATKLGPRNRCGGAWGGLG